MSDKLREALECAEYALTHPESNQAFALDAVRAALAAEPGQAKPAFDEWAHKTWPIATNLRRSRFTYEDMDRAFAAGAASSAPTREVPKQIIEIDEQGHVHKPLVNEERCFVEPLAKPAFDARALADLAEELEGECSQAYDDRHFLPYKKRIAMLQRFLERAAGPASGSQAASGAQPYVDLDKLPRMESHGATWVPLSLVEKLLAAPAVALSEEQVRSCMPAWNKDGLEGLTMALNALLRSGGKP